MSGDDALPAWAGRLASERERRGWNKHEMARRLRTAAGTEYPPVKSLVREVRNWETGKHFPRDWMSAYAIAFDLPVERLFGTNTPFPPPESPRSVIDGRVRDDWDDDMYRRAAMRLISALSAGATLPLGALETVLAGLDRTFGLRSELSVEDWDEVAWEYGHALVTVPSTQVAADLAVDLMEIRHALDNARSPRVRADLRRVTARLSAALAMALGDIQEHRGQRRAWRTARHAADASGDLDLRVWVRAREAHNARAANRPPQVAVTLTDDAIGLAAGRPSVGLAQAFANRAVSLGRLGDGTGARAALRELNQVFGALPGSMVRTPLWGWRECNLRNTEAWTYAYLGDPAGAGPAVDRALALRIADERYNQANDRFARAMYLVRGRQVADGLDHALDILAQAAPRHRPGLLRLIRRLLDALPDEKARALPAARELRALAAGTH